ncbi:MAG: hypothetical protein Q6363_008505 [Candidatus Njordarchaeota archaeon]
MDARIVISNAKGFTMLIIQFVIANIVIFSANIFGMIGIFMWMLTLFAYILLANDMIHPYVPVILQIITAVMFILEGLVITGLLLILSFVSFVVYAILSDSGFFEKRGKTARMIKTFLVIMIALFFMSPFYMPIFES